MQFHVGIPLCMKQRKAKALTELLSHPYQQFRIPVGRLDLEYFGDKNLKYLIGHMFGRMSYGHPDANKPVPLEEYRKGKICPEEEDKIERTKFAQNQKELRIWFDKHYEEQQKEE